MTKKSLAELAGGEEHLACLHPAHLSELAKARPLLVAQAREGPVALRRLGQARSRRALVLRLAGHPPRGDGGIVVSPLTFGIRRPTSSAKHQHQSSPGSSERMRRWPSSSACIEAWRFGESSQHTTFPHSRQIRR